MAASGTAAMASGLLCAAVTIDLIAGIGPTKSGDGGAIVVVTAACMVAVVCITVGIGPTKSGSACSITADSGSSAGESASGSRPIKSGSDSTTKAGAGDPGVGACVAGNRVVTAGIGPMNSGSARSTITGAGIVGEAVIDDAAIGIGPMNSAEGAGFTMGIVSMNSAEGAGSTMGIGTRGMTLSDACL